MRRLVAAAVLAAGLAVVAPTTPAGAADPACPAAYGAATLDPSSMSSGQVVAPPVPDSAWTFSCVYEIEGVTVNAGYAQVSWFEPGERPDQCGVWTVGEATDEEQGSTSVSGALPGVDVGYSYGVFDVPGAPTLDQVRALAERLADAVRARAATCSTPDACDVVGTVTDDDGVPVADVRVDLTGLTVQATTATDDAGGYRFTAYGGPGFVPETEPLQVRVLVEQPGEVVVKHAGEAAHLATAEFPVDGGGECRQDVSFESAAEALPAEPEKWPAVWAILRRTQRLFTFTTEGLAQRLDLLPVVVQAWCRGVHESCDGGRGAFRSGTSTLHEVEDPAIYLDDEASMAVAASTDDVLPHEFGHHVMGDAFDDETPLSPGRVAHGGYFENASSNDSWVEGFATFFAVMFAKHGERDGRPPGYRFPGGAEEDLELNLPAWSSLGRHEERSVSGLLIDLEDSSRDYLDLQPPVEPADVVTKVLTTPDGRQVVVGRIRRLAEGSLALLHLTLWQGRERVRTLPIWVDGGPDDLRSGDGVVFWAVVPAGVGFTRLEVSGLQERDNDDDPLDVTLGDLWLTIAEGSTRDRKRGKPLDYRHLFDVHELYQVLSARYGGPELDALMVEHGLFGDLDGDESYDDGEPVGMTSHPARDEQGVPVGDAVERFAPGLLPSQRVSVDDGDLEASYVVFVTHPEERAGASRSYLAVPGSDGRIDVVVPPEGSGGSTSVLALAEGRLPEVVAEIEAAEFWPQARAHDEAPFLTVRVSLEEGRVVLVEDPPDRWWVEHREALRVGGAAALLAAVLLAGLVRLSGRRSP